MAVYNKFKDNPGCSIYEIYHWEAHPSQYDDSHNFEEIPGNWSYQQPFTKPNDVTHRVIHFEKYREAYPAVTIPSLVDDGKDGNNPSAGITGCIVSKMFDASYTSIYIVGLDGSLIYDSHWPPGPTISFEIARLWVDTTYSSMDSIIEANIATSIQPVTGDFSVSPQKFIRIHPDGAVTLSMPGETRYSVAIFDMKGKCISSNNGQGVSRFRLSGVAASGVYIVRLTTAEGTYISPVCVANKNHRK